MWECETCKHKAVEGFINTYCLGCKRQYPNQEAGYYKPDRFQPVDESKVIVDEVFIKKVN